MEISVIFPAYNEEQNIQAAMLRARDALRPLFDRFEIIIVDDASQDRTPQIADALAAEYPEIRVIHNKPNKGQGESILIGFRAARHSLLIHNAMDYPFDLKDLRLMLPALAEADVVVAARVRRAGYTLYRKLTSVVNIAFLHLLFEPKLRDYNFVQLYRKTVFDSLPVQSRGPAFVTPEMLIRAHDMGYRIKEVEIEYHARERGEATAGKPLVILRSLRDMLAFWLQRRRERSAAPVAKEERA